MKNLVLSFLILLGIFLTAGAATIKADVSCQPIYGGGETCIQIGNIFVNKTVQNPQTGIFVDNLNVNDPKFSPSSIVTFRITVSNTGNATINKIMVKDTFPQFVTFVSGPGSFDANTKVLTFEIDSLTASETKTFTITGRTAEEKQLPQNQGTVCVINQVIATIENGSQSSDNAQFCIQKKVLGETKGGLKVLPAPSLTTTPSTGPEMLPLIGLIPTGLAGLILKRKSDKNLIEKEVEKNA